ncbi:MAG: CapA family protein [Melioribacteraceae bacterium]|nr:CapA family protein [Melioribacteraceae bacterium]
MDEYVNALKDTGFDLLITANNHSLDKWEKGLIRTIDKIEEAGLNKTGTFRSQSERDSLVIVQKMEYLLPSLLIHTERMEYLLPKGKDYLINLIDTTLISTDIQKAKEKGVDLVIVYYHFGEEYSLDTV